jgi:hypothetical protein
MITGLSRKSSLSIVAVGTKVLMAIEGSIAGMLPLDLSVRLEVLAQLAVLPWPSHIAVQG